MSPIISIDRNWIFLGKLYLHKSEIDSVHFTYRKLIFRYEILEFKRTSGQSIEILTILYKNKEKFNYIKSILFEENLEKLTIRRNNFYFVTFLAVKFITILFLLNSVFFIVLLVWNSTELVEIYYKVISTLPYAGIALLIISLGSFWTLNKERKDLLITENFLVYNSKKILLKDIHEIVKTQRRLFYPVKIDHLELKIGRKYSLYVPSIYDTDIDDLLITILKYKKNSS